MKNFEKFLAYMVGEFSRKVPRRSSFVSISTDAGIQSDVSLGPLDHLFPSTTLYVLSALSTDFRTVLCESRSVVRQTQVQVSGLCSVCVPRTQHPVVGPPGLRSPFCRRRKKRREKKNSEKRETLCPLEIFDVW